jgi:hypothetical protein
MMAVRVAITRCVDDCQPGWVECRLVDAAGKEWMFLEKIPVVSTADLRQDTPFPQPGVIACQIVARRYDADGRELVTVNTESPWGVESTSGCVLFEVAADQLVDAEA